jgi:hypothetical protein
MPDLRAIGASLGYRATPREGGVQPAGYHDRTTLELTEDGASRGDERNLRMTSAGAMRQALSRVFPKLTLGDVGDRSMAVAITGAPYATEDEHAADTYYDQIQVRYPGLVLRSGESQVAKELVWEKLGRPTSPEGSGIENELKAARAHGMPKALHWDSGEPPIDDQGYPVPAPTDRRNSGRLFRMVAKVGPFRDLTDNEINAFMNGSAEDRAAAIRLLAKPDRMQTPLDVVVEHIALGKTVRLSAQHLQDLTDSLSNPLLDHVSYDLSWLDVTQPLSTDNDALLGLAKLVRANPSRFVYGTDATATTNPLSYGAYDASASRFFDLISRPADDADLHDGVDGAMVAQKFFHGNLEDTLARAARRQYAYAMGPLKETPAYAALSENQRAAFDEKWSASASDLVARGLIEFGPAEPAQGDGVGQFRAAAARVALGAWEPRSRTSPNDAIALRPDLARLYAGMVQAAGGGGDVVYGDPAALAHMVNKATLTLSDAERAAATGPDWNEATVRGALEDRTPLTRADLADIPTPPGADPETGWTQAALDAADPTKGFHVDRAGQIDALLRTQLREQNNAEKGAPLAAVRTRAKSLFQAKRLALWAGTAGVVAGGYKALEAARPEIALLVGGSAFAARGAIGLYRWAGMHFAVQATDQAHAGEIDLDGAERLKEHFASLAGKIGRPQSVVDGINQAYDEQLIAPMRDGRLNAPDGSLDPAKVADAQKAAESDAASALGGNLPNLNDFSARTNKGRWLSLARLGTLSVNVAGELNAAIAHPLSFATEAFGGINTSAASGEIRGLSLSNTPEAAKENTGITRLRNYVVGPGTAVVGGDLVGSALAAGNPIGAAALSVFAAGSAVRAALGIADQRLIRVDPDYARWAKGVQDAGLAAYGLTQIGLGVARMLSSPSQPASILPPPSLQPPRPIRPAQPPPSQAQTRPKPKPAHQEVVTALDGVNERAAASPAAPIAGTLREGSYVDAIGRRGTANGVVFDEVKLGRTRSAWIDAADLASHPAGATNSSGGRYDPLLAKEGLASVVVIPGNTIFGIAAFHDVSPSATIALNAAHIEDPNVIYPGDIIYLPAIPVSPARP